MTIQTPEINRYAISIHSALIALLWTLFGLLWAYISSQRSGYMTGIELNAFFYFPAFMTNAALSKVLGTDVTQNLLGMGSIGAGLIILQNICVVYLLSCAIALGFILMSKKKDA